MLLFEMMRQVKSSENSCKAISDDNNAHHENASLVSSDIFVVL